MTGSEKPFVVFGDLTWRNFRSFFPKGESDFLNLDEDGLIMRFVPILMNAVEWATSDRNPAFPASRYSVPGKVVVGAVWNDESRADLFVDLLTHLTKQAVGSQAPTGNQLHYILGQANGNENFLAIVSRLVRVHLRRVLRARLRQSAYGHASELLISEIATERFVCLHGGARKTRDRVYGTSSVAERTLFDADGELFDRSVARFQEMKRNKVSLRMLNPGGDETFPRWFDRSELGKAMEDIIERVLGSATSLDFLLRALQQAIQDLDMFEEGLSPGGDEPGADFDNPFEEPEYWFRDVQPEDLPNLYVSEDFGFLLDEVDDEVREIVSELKRVFDQVDFGILWSNHQADGLSDEALGERLGVSAKTISRRRNGKIGPLLDQLRRREPLALLKALRVYLTEGRGSNG